MSSVSLTSSDPTLAPLRAAALRGVLIKRALLLAAVFALTGVIGSFVLRGWDRSADGGSMAGAPIGLLASLTRDTEYDLSLLRYFRIAATKVTTDYVDPARVEPPRMLRGALDQVARTVPEFLYRLDESGQSLTLVVGLDERTLGIGEVDGVPALATVMGEVAHFLNERLAPEVPRKEVEYAMMNGMLRTLDPHSFYIPPDAFEEMQTQNKGHFGGLGITIGIREERLTVLYPLGDTPAWRAGLKAGDRIDKIGRESTVNMELNEAVNKLRGQEGTQVTITVSDEISGEREVTLTRARIAIPSVKHAYAGDAVGYVQVVHFQEQTYDMLEDALDDLDTRCIEEGFGGLKGLILDLRGNPGGYLEQAVLMADKFIKKGTIVTTEGMAGTAKDLRSARGFGTEDDLPIVVLVDAGSASASEIVAGALQNQNRAIVLGTRTFGKGSVQNLYERNFDEGALKLTSARYLTPGDVSIQGVGIAPDVELRPAFTKREDDGTLDIRLFWDDFELREEDLDGAFAWGDEASSDQRLRWVFSCPECWDDPTRREREETADDNLRLPQVQAAKALLLLAPSNQRAEQLAAAEEALTPVLAPREASLVAWLSEQGIDWSAAPTAASGPAKLRVELRIRSEDGKLAPGDRTDITLAVTNEGAAPIHRFRAVTRGEFFEGREFVFGRLGAGETRTYTIPARPRLWLSARTEEVSWHFFADGEVVMPAPFVGRLEIKEVPRPRFAYSYALVDDGSGASVGNGDGLLQAGETVELLVTVKNIGEGPTSDLLRSDRGLLEAAEDADGDGIADREGGFLRFQNKSGPNTFLLEGSASFRLRPGELARRRLRFRVADEAVGLDTLQGQLVVGDERFLDVLTTDLELPLFSASGALVEDDRVVRPKGSGGLAVRSGASDLMPVVGRISGPVAVTGRLGDELRVPLPWGGSGWIAAAKVGSARAERVVEVEEVLPNSPPVLSLRDNPGGTVVTSDRLTLVGVARDDTAVKDIYVFVRNPKARTERKISYERLHQPVPEHAFTLTIELDPGVNEVEIFSRDEQDLRGSVTLSVYRETATAEAPAAGARAAGR